MALTSSRRGVTLIEAVLFTAVALGIIVGGLVFFQQASLAGRTKDTTQLLAAISTEVRALFGRHSSFSSDAMDPVNDVLIAANGVPASAVDEATGRILSPWGEDISVFVGRGLTCGTGERAYTIWVENVPPKLCARLTGYSEGGVGSFTNDLLVISMQSPRGTNSTLVYTDRVPETCIPDTIDPSWVDPAFTPEESGAACSVLDPNDNLIFFGMFFE